MSTTLHSGRRSFFKLENTLPKHGPKSAISHFQSGCWPNLLPSGISRWLLDRACGNQAILKRRRDETSLSYNSLSPTIRDFAAVCDCLYCKFNSRIEVNLRLTRRNGSAGVAGSSYNSIAWLGSFIRIGNYQAPSPYIAPQCLGDYFHLTCTCNKRRNYQEYCIFLIANIRHNWHQNIHLLMTRLRIWASCLLASIV